MFRVYDNENNKWVKDDVFVSQIGDVFIAKKSRMSKFGYEKMNLVSERKYSVQYSIGINDKNGRLIYAGDICKCDIEGGILCVVAYAADKGAYLLFDTENMVYYPILEELWSKVEVVGNVTDNPNMVPAPKNKGEAESAAEDKTDNADEKDESADEKADKESE